ncbi:hypothetical protein ELUMI_v1c08300 [Williamsoniiplasma luminosum]|uniref:Uncharacterized protein n=1 Tax=Williamsoniiplasma luminosum TaxID=214888 RepID=A0A2K8NXS3_9MOLU|nr:hypothetical protein ELUMI_v1c08300 [Williamsoniiplasma luminosum]
MTKQKKNALKTKKQSKNEQMVIDENDHINFDLILLRRMM